MIRDGDISRLTTMKKDECVKYIQQVFSDPQMYSVRRIAHIRKLLERTPILRTVASQWGVPADFEAFSSQMDFGQHFFSLANELLLDSLPRDTIRHVKNHVAIVLARTGEANALVFPASDGFVVVIDQGLFSLINRITRCYLLCIYRAGAPDLAVEKTLIDPKLIVFLFSLLFNYIVRGRPFAQRDLEQQFMMTDLPPLFREYHKNYVFSTTMYVIAHEYGHVLLDHFRNGSTSSYCALEVQLTTVRTTHVQEYEADAEGDRLLYELISSGRAVFNEDHFKNMAKCAPFILFSILEMLEKFAEVFLGRNAKTASHPAARDRMENVARRRGFSIDLTREFQLDEQDFEKNFILGALSILRQLWNAVEFNKQVLLESEYSRK